jgi:hypothetical protein
MGFMVSRAQTQRAQALQDGLAPPGSQLRFDVYRLELDKA